MHPNLSKASDLYAQIPLRPMNKIQGLALDPSQPLRNIQLPELTKMIHRAQRL